MNSILPALAKDFVPHRPPMLLVERVLRVEDDGASGEVSAVVSKDSPLLMSDGLLDPAAFIELIAQSFAAVSGAAFRDQPPRPGFLVGVREFTVHGHAREGDELRILVRKDSEFASFVMVEGEVLCADKRLAGGSIKLFLLADEDEEKS